MIGSRLRARLVSVAFTCGAAVAARAELTAELVVARVREALGVAALAEHAAGIQAAGSARLLGNDVSATFLFDARGRFVRQYSGPIPHAIGYDGTQAWQLEFSGRPRPLELGEKSDNLLTAAAITGLWTQPGAPFRFALDEARTTESQVVLRFEYTAGFESGTIEVDRQSWLPTLWTYAAGAAAPDTIKLSGTRAFGGFRVPAVISEQSGSGASGELRIAELGPAPTFVRSPYEPPRPGNADVQFAADVPAALDVERAPTGHLLVQPQLNGKPGGWFILDTGAGSTVLALGAAEGLAQEPLGTVHAVGTGGGVEAPIWRLERLTIGPLTVERPVVIGLDFEFLTAPLGRPIAGVIGYDILSRCVVELDLAGGKAALHDPAKFAHDAATWRTLHLPGRVPAIEATFEGHTGLLRLDSGASGTGLIFHFPAVERYKLLAGRETRDSRMGGVGGAVPVKQGTLKTLELAGQTLSDVAAGFVTEPRGAFASPYTAGVLGGPLLRRFTIVLDYPGNRIALRPNAEQ